MKTKDRILARHGHKTREELKVREDQILADMNISKSLQKRTDKERVAQAGEVIKKLVKKTGY